MWFTFCCNLHIHVNGELKTFWHFVCHDDHDDCDDDHDDCDDDPDKDEK